MRTDGTVDDAITHGGDQATEDGGIDDDLEVDVLPGRIGERSLETILLILREGDRRCGPRQPRGPWSWRRGTPCDRRWPGARGRAPSRSPSTRDERWSAWPCRRGGPPRSTGAWPPGCSRRPGRAQFLARLVGPSEAEQLVFDLVEGALGAGQFEQTAGVAVDAGVGGGVHCVPRPRHPRPARSLAARSLALTRSQRATRSLRRFMTTLLPC